MSTQEKIGSTDWLRKYVRRTLNHLLHKTRTFIVLSFNIVFRPRSAGIVNDEPSGVLDALKYFSKTFALAFTIYLIGGRFLLFEGQSEWRALVLISIVISFTIIIIYVLCLALPDRIPLLRLVQAALYVWGAYIFVDLALGVLFSYLRLPTGNRELDIFDTELQRCLADNSMLYWLVHGDLKYFLYNDVWRPKDWANWFFDHYNYVVIIPFIFIFALTLRPTRKISFILICLIFAIAYATVAEGSKFVKNRLTYMLASRDEKCPFTFLDHVTKNYAPDLIARQIAYKINNDALKSDTLFGPLYVQGTNFVRTARLLPDAEPTQELASELLLTLGQSYCSNISMYWMAARRINYNLVLGVFDKDDTILARQLLTPKDCPAWPTGK